MKVIDGDVEQLRLLPVTAQDRGLARCRLPDAFMKRHGISPNSWVCVRTAIEERYCRAWPMLGAHSDTHCQADASIRKPVAPIGTGSALPLICTIEALAADVPNAEHVNVKIIGRSNDSELRSSHALTEATSQTRNHVRQRLMGSIVKSGCLIGNEANLNELLFEIVDVEPQETCLVGRSTKINIVRSENEHAPVDGLPALSSPEGSEPLAGLEIAYKDLMEIVTYPLRYPRLIAKLNVEPPKGILLHGAPGVGKTMLVRTVAQSCGAKVIIIHGPEIFSPLFGESEERLRSAFREAVSLASSQSTPCILFIDEIDALAPRRDVSRPQENRIVAQLLTLMDGMESRGSLVVIGATNRPNAIDPALRRPGRFDREVTVDIPTAETRLAILKSLTSIMPLCEDVDLCQIAEATNGYVGADLAALCREAALDAINHSPEATAITQASFQHAMHICGASTQRDSVVRFSKTSWDEIGGLEDVKQSLRQMVEWPLKYQETYRRLRLKPPRGVLLYGPPGCSKTTLVKIIASSTGATFLSLSGATLYSPYVGDSEQAVRSIFQRARAGAPSIVFFDEIDAIVGKRAFDGSSGAQADTVQERVLSTLLNEMDGIELANDVLVVGATNRPDMIDAALMRPGRFDRVIYVPPPEESARKEILDLYTGKMALDTAVDNSALAGDRTERYTGADLKAVCREAAMEALRESREAQTVLPRHFDRALLVVKPTLSMQMLAQYQAFAEQFGTGVI